MKQILLILALFFASFVNAQSISGASEDKLIGSWLRSDGTYTIEIIRLVEGGILSSKYFNPNPIHIGEAGWRILDNEIQIYVELQDTYYPGCIYELSYNESSEMLTGTYYHAVSKQTFEVDFKKSK